MAEQDQQKLELSTPPTSDQAMSAAERRELRAFVRSSSKVVKQAIEVRASQRLAELEDQIVADREEAERRWREAEIEFIEEMTQLQDRLRERAKELDFRDHELPFVRIERGSEPRHHADSLRRTARARVEADVQSARLAVDAIEARLLRRLATESISSEAAKRMLEEIPEPGKLMPMLDIGQLELVEGTEARRLPFGDDVIPF